MSPLIRLFVISEAKMKAGQGRGGRYLGVHGKANPQHERELIQITYYLMRKPNDSQTKAM